MQTRRDIRVLSGLSHLALAFWALIIIGPIVWVFLSSFKSPEEIFSSPWTIPAELRWDNWVRAWNTAHIGRYMLNSVKVVAISTFGTMLLGSMAAYVLARYRFAGNRAIYFLFVSGLAFPIFLALVPLFFVLRDFPLFQLWGNLIGNDNQGLLGTHTGLILTYIAWSLPFTIFFLSAFFKTLPTSIAEAALIDGAGHYKLFFRVMLPMAKPGLISVGIFNLIGQWAQYLLPLYLIPGGEDTESRWLLTQGIASISTSAGFRSDWEALFAAITIAILPMIIIYALMQRQIQAGLTAGAMK
ncbi:MAG TPA: carbohydrate ABC transporter permease [Candidatus Limnocylindrales bacterium]|nr:carbohydrate ABC transporter permease [Candidatus Limnocylindrales bacterium]